MRLVRGCDGDCPLIADPPAPKPIGSPIRRIFRPQLTLFVVAAAITLLVSEIFFRVDEPSGYSTVFGAERAQAESSILSSAGPPNRTLSPATGDCARQGGIRELVYEQASRGIFGLSRRIVDAQVVLCVGQDGRVLDVLHVNF
jgi:hypothetical protein